MKHAIILIAILLLAPLAAGQAANASEEADASRKEFLDIRDFGPAGDGTTINTAAIQKAIDACTANGGGQVLVAGGRYVTGTIHLKDHVTLNIASGAVLLGSTNIADYTTDTHKNIYAGEPHLDRCLIFARGAVNIGLTGHGTIDGQGDRKNFPTPGDPGMNRPMLIRFMECSRIRLRDLTLSNPASWTSAWLYCDDIVVDGLTIRNRANGNGDGLDFDGCGNVCEGGAMKNMQFSNIVMRNVPRPVFMTFNHWRMGVASPAELPPMKTMSDFQFSHIRVDNSELANTPTGIVLGGVPGHFIENISFDDISLTSPGGGTAAEAAIRDLPEFVDRRPEFGVLGNEIPFAGFYARHVRGLTLSNLRFEAVKPEAKAAIVCENVERFDIAGAKLGPAFSGESVIRLRRVKDGAVRDCSSLGITGAFVRIEQSQDSDVAVAPNKRHRSLKSTGIAP